MGKATGTTRGEAWITNAKPSALTKIDGGPSEQGGLTRGPKPGLASSFPNGTKGARGDRRRISGIKKGETALSDR